MISTDVSINATINKGLKMGYTVRSLSSPEEEDPKRNHIHKHILLQGRAAHKDRLNKKHLKLTPRNSDEKQRLPNYHLFGRTELGLRFL